MRVADWSPLGEDRARAAFDDAAPRRRDQASDEDEERARAIADGLPVPDPGHYRAPPMTLPYMLHRFVFLQDGAQVASLANPRVVVSLADFEKWAASSMMTLRTEKGIKQVSVARKWLQDPARITVHSRTFAPGEGPFCTMPESGQPVLNTWRPIPHATPARWEERAAPFLEHVGYLVPEVDQRGTFLDWLAHAEQRPQELPHSHWLLIARSHGIGRNWLATLIAKVWPGYVAADLDLAGMLSSGFNGRLASKLMATVSEIREGGKHDIYAHAEALKQLLTEPTRVVNPKYGRQYVEANVIRWLIFSNHVNALPIDENDRRLHVVENPSTPKAPEYYSKLYQLLADPLFPPAVRELLRRRNVARFNPGMHPPMTMAKQLVVAVGTSDARRAAREVAERWPSDCITTTDLRCEVFGNDAGESRFGSGAAARERNALRHAALDAGMTPYGRRVKVDADASWVWIIRNPEKWLGRRPLDIGDEVRRGIREAAKGMARDGE